LDRKRSQGGRFDAVKLWDASHLHAQTQSHASSNWRTGVSVFTALNKIAGRINIAEQLLDTLGNETDQRIFGLCALALGGNQVTYSLEIAIMLGPSKKGKSVGEIKKSIAETHALL